MSLDRRPVVCRLCDEAYEALELICGIEQKDLGERGREILERALSRPHGPSAASVAERDGAD